MREYGSSNQGSSWTALGIDERCRDVHRDEGADVQARPGPTSSCTHFQRPFRGCSHPEMAFFETKHLLLSRFMFHDPAVDIQLP
jgi:hypothetical protein